MTAKFWQRGYNVGNLVTFDDVSGITYGEADPTVIDPMGQDGVPASTLYLRTNPAQIWQKQSLSQFDWILKSEGEVKSVPELHLPFLMSNGDVLRLPFSTDCDLPFLLADGSEIQLEIGV